MKSTEMGISLHLIVKLYYFLFDLNFTKHINLVQQLRKCGLTRSYHRKSPVVISYPGCHERLTHWA